MKRILIHYNSVKAQNCSLCDCLYMLQSFVFFLTKILFIVSSFYHLLTRVLFSPCTLTCLCEIGRRPSHRQEDTQVCAVTFSPIRSHQTLGARPSGGSRGGKRRSDLQSHTPIHPPVWNLKHPPSSGGGRSFWSPAAFFFFFFPPDAIVRFVFSSRLCDHLWRWQTRLCLASGSLCSDPDWVIFSSVLADLTVEDSEEIGWFYFSASSAPSPRLDRKIVTHVSMKHFWVFFLRC